MGGYVRRASNNCIEVSTREGDVCSRVVVDSGNYKVDPGSLPRVFREFCGTRGSSPSDINVNLSLTGSVIRGANKCVATSSGLNINSAFGLEFLGMELEWSGGWGTGVTIKGGILLDAGLVVPSHVCMVFNEKTVRAIFVGGGEETAEMVLRGVPIWELYGLLFLRGGDVVYDFYRDFIVGSGYLKVFSPAFWGL